MQTGIRKRASDAVNGRFPRLSWNLWSAGRTARQMHIRDVGPAITNQLDRHRSPRLDTNHGPRLLLVVPSADHVQIPWQPAQGNYSFELYETACAYMGTDRVHTIRIASGGTAQAYHQQIVDYLHEHKITHVLSRIDIESNGDPHWNWDLFARLLRSKWSGVFLPLSYDSAYPYVSMHLDRITRLYSKAMPIVLDRPIAGVIRPNRPAAGPLFLPLSDASTNLILETLHEITPEYDLTFIGNVAGYPYRADLLAALEAEGLNVTVNPQGRSATAMPGFMEYAAALRRSKVTLNFTRCNGVPITQLKTRLLEGSLFGAVVAADSALYARDYFLEGEEFICYNSPQNLHEQLINLAVEPNRLESMRTKAFAKANDLRVSNFWLTTNDTLVKRGFPPLNA